jgi:hypothetical protein
MKKADQHVKLCRLDVGIAKNKIQINIDKHKRISTMLNRNDPLIGAVQEVMRKNQAERDATKAVNEKFGITDRKALPHEKQAEWDSAYNTIITEGTNAGVLNEEMSPKQKQLAAVAGNKKKIDAPDLAAARKGGASHIEEEQIDELSADMTYRAAGVAGKKHDAAVEKGHPKQAKAYSDQGTRIAKYSWAKRQKERDSADEAGLSSLKRNYLKKKISEDSDDE